MQLYPEKKAPFDAAVMLENIGGDEEMLHVLLRLFMETADSTLANLHLPLEEMSAEEYTLFWQRQLHLLRGSALNIGAEDFCNCLFQSEYDAPKMTPLQKMARLELLKSIYSDLRTYIVTILP